MLFLFKIITNLDEELREIGLKIFVKVFKKFIDVDESGNL
jgi:hypothetical protein